MKSIRSSWNSDRVAACVENRPRKVSAQKKVVKMYTEIRGNSVAVKTYRHAVKFAHVYEAKVVSAHLGDEALVIELENGSIYEYARKGNGFALMSCLLPRETEKGAGASAA